MVKWMLMAAAFFVIGSFVYAAPLDPAESDDDYIEDLFRTNIYLSEILKKTNDIASNQDVTANNPYVDVKKVSNELDKEIREELDTIVFPDTDIKELLTTANTNKENDKNETDPVFQPGRDNFTGAWNVPVTNINLELNSTIADSSNLNNDGVINQVANRNYLTKEPKEEESKTNEANIHDNVPNYSNNIATLPQNEQSKYNSHIPGVPEYNQQFVNTNQPWIPAHQQPYPASNGIQNAPPTYPGGQVLQQSPQTNQIHQVYQYPYTNQIPQNQHQPNPPLVLFQPAASAYQNSNLQYQNTQSNGPNNPSGIYNNGNEFPQINQTPPTNPPNMVMFPPPQNQNGNQNVFTNPNTNSNGYTGNNVNGINNQNGFQNTPLTGTTGVITPVTIDTNGNLYYQNGNSNVFQQQPNLSLTNNVNNVANQGTQASDGNIYLLNIPKNGTGGQKYLVVPIKT